MTAAILMINYITEAIYYGVTCYWMGNHLVFMSHESDEAGRRYEAFLLVCNEFACLFCVMMVSGWLLAPYFNARVNP